MTKNNGAPSLQILLATYKGGRFLREQLDSLFRQTYADWQILARDDGSPDDTVAILREYAAKHPGRLALIEDGETRLGACRNFGRLLEQSSAPYVMFCDQDDVWKEDKIEKTLGLLRNAESRYPGKAVAVHTDLTVVDTELNVIAESFWSYEKLSPAWADRLPSLAVQNVLTGCTMAINAQARKLCLPVPPEAVMHDWWIALKVCQAGVIEALPEQTILYRQHNLNDVGAKQVDSKYFAQKAAHGGKAVNDFMRIVRMAKKVSPKLTGFRLLFTKAGILIQRMSRKF